MAGPRVAPYGGWASPFSGELVASAAVGFSWLHAEGGNTWWLEVRPNEGRTVLVRRSAGGDLDDVTSDAYDVRTRVHEYGGGACAVAGDSVYFSNFSDGRVRRSGPHDDGPAPLTPAGELRFADFCVDARRRRLISVCEDHRVPAKEPVNSLVSIAMASGVDGELAEPASLIEGNDFYAAPRLSPDGSRLSWLTWNHPHMPWDATELWLATVTETGDPVDAVLVAGGPDESIVQPQWSTDGVLHFLSDRSGWWNLYRLEGATVRAVLPMEADFGAPQWQFDSSTYDVAGSLAVCAISTRGRNKLLRIDTQTGSHAEIQLPFSVLGAVRVDGGRAVMIAAGEDVHARVIEVDMRDGSHRVLRTASDLAPDPGTLSRPEAIEFPTTGERTAHAFYYPPCNPDHVAPPGELPPLLVRSHGGPTSATRASLDLSVQFWTSRGYAFVDVNYGGSVGYGREYRQRLKGEWGVVDVDDCINAVRYLADRGDVDGRRALIRGGSAGGYTTLCALTFRDIFVGGASYFGISDLDLFHGETHKFEATYDEWLVGPYPERRDLFIERSPIHRLQQLRRPIILLQGLDDKVVPPDQSEIVFDALRGYGVPCAYVAFPGEAHGFRHAATIRRAIESELFFFSRVLGVAPADDLEPVDIVHAEKLPAV
ncbi:MAG TPA: prolyl oligopeptidase family serine peptidase [Candidatus Dormibacteraeota bacterium]|jgi:dipeptidyl aminopeptidase/acylaminoacyl peptidase